MTSCPHTHTQQYFHSKLDLSCGVSRPISQHGVYIRNRPGQRLGLFQTQCRQNKKLRVKSHVTFHQKIQCSSYSLRGGSGSRPPSEETKATTKDGRAGRRIQKRLKVTRHVLDEFKARKLNTPAAKTHKYLKYFWILLRPPFTSHLPVRPIKLKVDGRNGSVSHEDKHTHTHSHLGDRLSFVSDEHSNQRRHHGARKSSQPPPLRSSPPPSPSFCLINPCQISR